MLLVLYNSRSLWDAIPASRHGTIYSGDVSDHSDTVVDKLTEIGEEVVSHGNPALGYPAVKDQLHRTAWLCEGLSAPSGTGSHADSGIGIALVAITRADLETIRGQLMAGFRVAVVVLERHYMDWIDTKVMIRGGQHRFETQQRDLGRVTKILISSSTLADRPLIIHKGFSCLSGGQQLWRECAGECNAGCGVAQRVFCDMTSMAIKAALTGMFAFVTRVGTRRVHWPARINREHIAEPVTKTGVRPV